MLLTKIKGAALVLLLAASVSVGTVGLTYRTATAQTGQQTAAEAQERADQARTATKALRTERDDLESLRLEVEALRVSLQATKQRVKALEAVVQARQAPGGSGFIGTAPVPGAGGPVAAPEISPGGSRRPIPHGAESSPWLKRRPKSAPVGPRRRPKSRFPEAHPRHRPIGKMTGRSRP